MVLVGLLSVQAMAAPAHAVAIPGNAFTVDQSPVVDFQPPALAISLANPPMSAPPEAQFEGSLLVRIGERGDPDPWWFVNLMAPAGQELTVGRYTDVGSVFGPPDKPRLRVGQVGGDMCGSAPRWFRIDEITYVDGALASLAVDIRCEEPAPVTVELRFHSDRPVDPVASTPPSVSFARTLAGTSSAPSVVTVGNVGPGTLHPAAATLEGPDAADFAIVADACGGATVAMGAGCDVTVRFLPADGPALGRQAAIRIPTGTLAGSRTVPLRGLVRRPTTIAVTSDANPATMGNPVTFTAVITPQPQHSTVTWTLDGTDVENHWSDLLSLSWVGQHTVSARYEGSEEYAPSTSNVVNQVTYGRSEIRWTVWPSFNRPPGVLDISADLTTVGTVWPPGGTLTVRDDTTGEVLGATTATGSGQVYVRLTAINLPGLHYLRGEYTGFPPYTLPTESTVLVEGTPPTDPAPVVQLFVGGLETLRYAGRPGSVTVKALDARGALAETYRGTVHVTSSDPGAELPGDYTFLEGDAGTRSLPVTLHTQGDQSITVTDVETGSILGTQHVVVGPAFAPEQIAPVAVSVGPGHACAVAADGVVECWGTGDFGELGIRIQAYRNVHIDTPGPVPAITTAVGVAAGATHTCAVLRDGTVWCWGDNTSGQAPRPNMNNDVPVAVADVAGALAVSAGDRHSCALLDTGSVVCWGDQDGKAAHGVATVAGITTATSVASGAYHTCALLRDGGVRCWGANWKGELGDGTTTDSEAPVAVAGIDTAIAIAADGNTSCAVLADNTVRCWGDNAHGQLGDATTTDSAAPVTVAGVSGAVAVTIGIDHACAILGDRSVRCWGANDQGQLGDGTSTPRTAAVSPGIVGIQAISAGGRGTCALGATGLSCWGRGEEGQLGDGATRQLSPVAPVGLANGALPADHGPCALLPAGTVRCWGANESGQLGIGTTDDGSPYPVTVHGVTGAIDVSADGNGACVVTAGGTVECWGNNYVGRAAVGTTIDQLEPVAIPGVVGATDVALGRSHACARLDDGRVTCWGGNGRGELGDGSSGEWGAHAPVIVSGVTTAIAVAVAGESSCALLASGGVTCWGGNTGGQLGNGTGSDSPIPVAVSGIDTAVAVSIEDRTGCAALADGTIRCWGVGEDWQFGDGTQSWHSTPVAIPGIDDAVDVAVGYAWVCAASGDGTIRCWGRNGNGQLGDGTNLDRTSPTVVPGVHATAVRATNGGACAPTLDGSVRCWGGAASGAMGNGRRPYSPSPVPVAWPTEPRLAVTLEVPAMSATLKVPVIVTASVDATRIAAWYLDDIIEGPTPEWSAENLIAPATFTFDAGDAARTLHAWVIDTQGHASLTTVATTVIDTTPPGANGKLPAVTKAREVPITITGSDAGTGVAGWLVSEVPVSPRADDPRWTARAPDRVMLSPGDGAKRVYVWTRDGANNVSVPAAPKTSLDTLPPGGGAAPVVSLRTSTGAATSVPLSLSWRAATDLQPGPVRYEIAYRRDGAASFTPISLAAPTARSASIALAAGTYRFRVRALDQAGNASSWYTTPSLTVRVASETSTLVRYAGTFSRGRVTGASGGWVRYSTTAGRSATLVATARSLAFVSTRGRGRGIAQVWLDGVKVASVDLYSTSTRAGQVVWQRSFASAETHRLRILVTGSKRPAATSRRVDIDAFLIVR